MASKYRMMVKHYMLPLQQMHILGLMMPPMQVCLIAKRW